MYTRNELNKLDKLSLVKIGCETDSTVERITKRYGNGYYPRDTLIDIILWRQRED